MTATQHTPDRLSATDLRLLTDLDPAPPTPPAPPTSDGGTDPEELPPELLTVVTTMGQKNWILAWSPGVAGTCTVRFGEATLEEYREMFSHLERAEPRWGVSRVDLHRTLDGAYRAVVRFERPRNPDQVAASVVCTELLRVTDHAANPRLLEAFSCRLRPGAPLRVRPQIRLEVDDLVEGVQLLRDLGQGDLRFEHVIACPAAGSLITAGASI